VAEGTAARVAVTHRATVPRLIGAYAGLVPAGLLFGLFFFVPLLIVVLYSFWQVVDYNVVSHWTLDNYVYFFSHPTYLRTAWVTIWMSTLATILAVSLAFPFAYWLARHVPRRFRGALLVLAIVPFWTSYLLRIYSWLTILGREGLLNRLLQWLGITHHPVSVFLYDRPAVVFVLVYLYLPFAVLVLYSAMDRFDWNQLRAATDLGARPLTAIRRILLPQIRPAFVTSIIFVFVPCMLEFLTPQIIGGTRGVMIGVLVVNFFQALQYTRGAAVALLVTGLIVTLLLIFRRSLSTRDLYGV
jgi:spermidine/putrescine transport system permease protein